MSAGNGMTRSRYRFAKWKLSAMPGVPVRLHGKCLTCGQRSPDTSDADDTQLWCLKHAGATHHSAYELSAFQYFNATMPNQPADGPPPAS